MTTASAMIVAAASSKGGGGLTPLLLLVALAGFTYLILIRPQRARAKALQRTQATLEPGVEIMTTAGLYATVVEIGDGTVTLETSPGVTQRYARAAVARIITPAASDENIDDDSDEQDSDEQDSAEQDGEGEDSDGETPDDASAVER